MASEAELPANLSSANRGLVIVGIGTSMGILSTVFVGLRFWARGLTKLHRGLDDWILAVSLLFIYGYITTSIIAVYYGGTGRPLTTLTNAPEVLGRAELYLSISDLIYATTIGLLKVSILIMYLRIFPTRTVRLGSYTLGSIVFMWWLAICLISVFQCQPIQKAWGGPITDKGKCIDKGKWFLGVAIPNIVTDAAILFLPVYEIWHLQVSKGRKLAIAGIFLMGGFVTIISCIRAKCLLDVRGEVDQTFTERVACVWWWSDLEISIGCISACLPTLPPVVRQVYRHLCCHRATLRDSHEISDTTLIIDRSRGKEVAVGRTESPRSIERVNEDGVSTNDIYLEPSRFSNRKTHLNYANRNPTSTNEDIPMDSMAGIQSQ